MKAEGIFLVVDVNKRISTKSNMEYLEVFLKDIDVKGDVSYKNCILPKSEFAAIFRSIYLGSGIEKGHIYKIDLILNICDKNIDCMIDNFKLLDKKGYSMKS